MLKEEAREVDSPTNFIPKTYKPTYIHKNTYTGIVNPLAPSHPPLTVSHQGTEVPLSVELHAKLLFHFVASYVPQSFL